MAKTQSIPAVELAADFYAELCTFIAKASPVPELANVVNDARALQHRMVRDCGIIEEKTT